MRVCCSYLQTLNDLLHSPQIERLWCVCETLQLTSSDDDLLQVKFYTSKLWWICEHDSRWRSSPFTTADQEGSRVHPPKWLRWQPRAQRCRTDGQRSMQTAAGPSVKGSASVCMCLQGKTGTIRAPWATRLLSPLDFIVSIQREGILAWPLM